MAAAPPSGGGPPGRKGSRYRYRGSGQDPGACGPLKTGALRAPGGVSSLGAATRLSPLRGGSGAPPTPLGAQGSHSRNRRCRTRKVRRCIQIAGRFLALSRPILRPPGRAAPGRTGQPLPMPRKNAVLLPLTQQKRYGSFSY